MKTLEQERAEFAWKHTEGADKDFKKLVSGAPVLIMQNGLMQALAYYQDKKHKKLVEAIVERLAATVLKGKVSASNFDVVMQQLHTGDSDLYLRATEETLETLRWVRQFAKARVRE